MFYNQKNDQYSLIETFQHKIFDVNQTDLLQKINSKFDEASMMGSVLNRKLIEGLLKE